jgi:hypothetical protein
MSLATRNCSQFTFSPDKSKSTCSTCSFSSSPTVSPIIISIMFLWTFLFLSIAALNIIHAEAKPERALSPNNYDSVCIASDDDFSHFHCNIISEKPRVDCIDQNPQCSDWSKQGECSSNPQFMLTECRFSCGSCLDSHTSGVQQIAPDATTRPQVLQKLVETQEYLHTKAKHSVQSLTKCLNKHSLCTHWSVMGECKTNEVFMQAECAPACQTCEKVL